MSDDLMAEAIGAITSALSEKFGDALDTLSVEQLRAAIQNMDGYTKAAAIEAVVRAYDNEPPPTGGLLSFGMENNDE